MSETEAIQNYRALQKSAVLFDQRNHLSVAATALRLGFSVDWVRDHLDAFPNAWRAPGGQIRIPVRDIEALARAGRFLKTGKTDEVPA